MLQIILIKPGKPLLLSFKRFSRTCTLIVSLQQYERHKLQGFHTLNVNLRGPAPAYCSVSPCKSCFLRGTVIGGISLLRSNPKASKGCEEYDWRRTGSCSLAGLFWVFSLLQQSQRQDQRTQQRRGKSRKSHVCLLSSQLMYGGRYLVLDANLPALC